MYLNRRHGTYSSPTQNIYGKNTSRVLQTCQTNTLDGHKLSQVYGQTLTEKFCQQADVNAYLETKQPHPDAGRPRLKKEDGQMSSMTFFFLKFTSLAHIGCMGFEAFVTNIIVSKSQKFSLIT